MEPETQSSSLPYHEPGIVTILIQSSLLLLLNLVNFVLDKALYCGLLGQVFLGVAWGTPGAKWLGTEIEGVIVELGYLGLLLLVYEGGLSTSLQSLKANILLSSGVAITGISLPIGLSFVLSHLTDATPIQCFAAGAALCSTSLGTTFTVLSTSGLVTSRLGVVLSSAAMMDDVVGLVMVEIISKLGQGSTSVGAITVVRPLLVSLAFAVCAPLVCLFIAKPTTLWLNAQRTKRPTGYLQRGLGQHGAASAFVIHTLILLGIVAGSTYAGTSNLFAAYIAGASVSWWDSEVPHTVPVESTHIGGTAPTEPRGTLAVGEGAVSASQNTKSGSCGLEIYERYYLEPVNRVLRPFFFASIGFSIPITEMFSGKIVWKGIVYTILMVVGKVACGFWLVRLPLNKALPTKLKNRITSLPLSRLNHFWGQKTKKPIAQTTQHSSEPSHTPSGAPELNTHVTTTSTEASVIDTSSAANPHTAPAGIKPRSIYPASILGCAMTARGEIGFLISSIAESNGVFASESDQDESSDNFLVVTWAIVLCTIIGPLTVGLLVRRVKNLQQGVEKEGRVVRGDVLGVWGVS